MALTNAQLVTELYVGYLNRAPDPAGLQYWLNVLNSGATLAQIAEGFAASSEAASIYPYLSLPGIVPSSSFVDQVYLNILNRAADPDGRAYWIAQLDSGRVTASQFILAVETSVNSQVGTNDAITLADKTLVGLDYVTKIAAANVPYSQASAKAALAPVSVSSPPTQVQVDAALALNSAYVANPTPDGTTFTLSVNADGPGAVPPAVNTNGTDKGDTYNSVIDGANSTLNSSDTIDGKGGVDTLNVRILTPTATVAPTLANVEIVNATALAAVGQEINLVSATGLTTVTNSGSVTGSNVFFSNVAATAAIALTNVGAASTTTVGFAGSAGRAGPADAFGVTVNGAGAATGAAILSLNGDATFEVANITASGKGSFLNLQAPGVDTIKVTGAATAASPSGYALSLGGALGLVKSIDATGLSAAGLSIDLGGSGNTKDVTFTGSAFNDAIKMGAGLTTADKLDGGAGNDVIGVTDGSTLVTGLQVTNFETLDIGGANLTSTYDVSKIAGITGLLVSSNLNQSVGAQIETINNLAKLSPVTISAALGFPGDGDGLIINVKDAGPGSPNDTITVNLTSPSAVTTFGSLTINDIETVNLTSTSSGVGNTHTLTSLIDASATTVNVNASTAGLNINSLADAALVLFDASASVKAVGLITGANAYTAASGVAFTLGAGADTLNLTGDTFAAPTKGAIVTGNGSGDTITLEAAGFADTVILKAAADSQVGATKFDTVNTFVAALSEDKIDLKVFGFTGGQAVSFDKVPVTPVGPNGEVAAADATNFFLDGVNKAVAEVMSGGNTWVYVDVNKDGSFQAGADAALLVTGVLPPALLNANYLFA